LTRFSQAQLQDEKISGDNADSDGDGLTNFKEYILGLNPLAPDSDKNQFQKRSGEMMNLLSPEIQ
jgi:hypothetical protein